MATTRCTLVSDRTEIDTTDRLIRENADAPADRIIRGIFENGCRSVSEVNDGDKFESAEELLRYWYDVDAMAISFVATFDVNGIPTDRTVFVHLVHQRSMHHPHIEDLVDYSTLLEGAEWFKACIDEDSMPLRFVLC